MEGQSKKCRPRSVFNAVYGIPDQSQYSLYSVWNSRSVTAQCMEFQISHSTVYGIPDQSEYSLDPDQEHPPFYIEYWM